MRPAALPSDLQARWDAYADTVTQMAAAVDDEEGFRAAAEAMRQASIGIDHQKILNALHVPADAGEHADALQAMLLRIPDGWGRWISCDRGWYPLLVELDEQLRALLPDYVIHQVKEKFGGLRYYWESGEEIHDPDDTEPATPGRNGDETEWERWRNAHDAWWERTSAYQETNEGRERIADLQQRVELAERLVDTAEARAGITCELCGATGLLHRTPASTPWYKTLCSTCATRADYVPTR
ncbi:MAG: hypothetical protein ACRDK4_05395 [Solirubrobacteraceae bacterium]